MEQKNILICLNILDIGGVETAAVNQIMELRRRGYNVIVLAKTGIYTKKIVDIGAIFIDFDFEVVDRI